MRCEWVFRVRRALLVVLMCVLLGLGMGAAEAPDQRMPPGFRQLTEPMEARSQDARQEATGINQVLNVSYRMADVSLAVREQVDFLLTPALLVQEAVSEDAVLTYPEE